MAEIKVKSLKVERGDCFIIHIWDSDFELSLVIDSGNGGAGYEVFQNEIVSLFNRKGSNVSMLLTHIDADHITGFKNLFKNPTFDMYDRLSCFYYNTFDCIKQMWPEEMMDILQINQRIITHLKQADRIVFGRKTSYLQGKELERLLTEKGVNIVTNLFAGRKLRLGEHVHAVVLTPTIDSVQAYKSWLLKREEPSNRHTSRRQNDYGISLDMLVSRGFYEDYGKVNASSISLLIEAYGRRLLFLGDAPSHYVAQSLHAMGYSKECPLHADLVKLSHHGSRKSTSPELLNLIQSGCFLNLRYHFPAFLAILFFTG